MGFEPTDHIWPSVFKTGTINRTLPTLHFLFGGEVGTRTLIKWLTATRSSFELQPRIPRKAAAPFSLTLSDFQEDTFFAACLPTVSNRLFVFFGNARGIRTLTRQVLNLLSLPVGLERHLVGDLESN